MPVDAQALGSDDSPTLIESSRLLYWPGETVQGFENVIGSNFADSITGNAANNSLSGGLGNDTVNGGSGNNFLAGGIGADTFVLTRLLMPH